MSRLPLIIVLFASLCACRSVSEMHQSQVVAVYYRNGVDGWFNVLIDLNRRIIRSNEEVQHLAVCNSAKNKLCFFSSLLSFASPPPGERVWRVDGIEYRLDGSCKLVVCSKTRAVPRVIHSAQQGNEIDFYYSADFGLLGWTMTFLREGGKTMTYYRAQETGTRTGKQGHAPFP